MGRHQSHADAEYDTEPTAGADARLPASERLINRYSNPGDTVFDPFAGLFTVPKLAVDMGRRGVGVELNLDYFRDGVGYMRTAEAQVAAPTLFDLLDEKNAV